MKARKGYPWQRRLTRQRAMQRARRANRARDRAIIEFLTGTLREMVFGSGALSIYSTPSFKRNA